MVWIVGRGHWISCFIDFVKLEARNKDGDKRPDGVCLLCWPLGAGLCSEDSEECLGGRAVGGGPRMERRGSEVQDLG